MWRNTTAIANAHCFCSIPGRTGSECSYSVRHYRHVFLLGAVRDGPSYTNHSSLLFCGKAIPIICHVRMCRNTDVYKVLDELLFSVVGSRRLVIGRPLGDSMSCSCCLGVIYCPSWLLSGSQLGYWKKTLSDTIGRGRCGGGIYPDILG